VQRQDRQRHADDEEGDEHRRHDRHEFRDRAAAARRGGIVVLVHVHG
jgi:hypothetical protein